MVVSRRACRGAGTPCSRDRPLAHEAGAEQHPQSRPQLARGARQADAADPARHDHVGEQQIDLGRRLDHLQRLGGVGRGGDLVAELVSRSRVSDSTVASSSTSSTFSSPPTISAAALRGGPARRPVRTSAGAGGRSRRRPARSPAAPRPRTGERSRRPGDRPSPVPLPTSLVVKKGSNTRAQHLGRHADAGVADRDRHLVAGRLSSPGLRAARCGSTASPALRHGVARIDREVEQRGLELGRVDVGAQRSVASDELDGDRLADRLRSSGAKLADQALTSTSPG